MTFTPAPLMGSYIVDLSAFVDERGWFARYYCKKEFSEIGFDKEWVQMNHSVNYQKGTVRGMHYQLKPYREIKMVRCIAGKVFDVIIDIRENSSTFLNWFGLELSAENKKMIFIPEGFAHGFQCLDNNCELLYHHSEYYQPGAEAGIRYNDPIVKINWPLPVTVISERDSNHLLLDEKFNGV